MIIIVYFNLKEVSHNTIDQIQLYWVLMKYQVFVIILIIMLVNPSTPEIKIKELTFLEL